MLDVSGTSVAKWHGEMLMVLKQKKHLSETLKSISHLILGVKLDDLCFLSNHLNNCKFRYSICICSETINCHHVLVFFGTIKLDPSRQQAAALWGLSGVKVT